MTNFFFQACRCEIFFSYLSLLALPDTSAPASAQLEANSPSVPLSSSWEEFVDVGARAWTKCIVYDVLFNLSDTNYLVDYS